MNPSEETSDRCKMPRRLRLFDAAYAAGLVLGLPYIAARAVVDTRYRDALGERFGSGDFAPEDGPRVWFHGASAGEVLAARDLHRIMDAEVPGLQTVFSTLTYTGKRAAARAYPDCGVRYLPLDMRCTVMRALARVRPDLVVLVEGDIWPNFICAAKSLGARIAVVNGRFSKRSAGRYARLRILFRPAFDAIDVFCLRDEEQAGHVAPLGIPRKKILVTGSIKYDNLNTELGDTRERLRNVLGISESEKVVVGGSTHRGEEEPLLELLASRTDFRLVLVPRYPHRVPEIEKRVEERNLSAVRYSDVVEGKTRPSPGDVIVVDTVGDLADMYRLATIAFVGGSLIPRGGQNLLEPAALGTTVVFGRHAFNFKEDVEMLRRDNAAVEVRSTEELRLALSSLLDDPERRMDLGARARNLVLEKRGASRRTFDRIEGLIQERV